LRSGVVLCTNHKCFMEHVASTVRAMVLFALRQRLHAVFGIRCSVPNNRAMAWGQLFLESAQPSIGCITFVIGTGSRQTYSVLSSALQLLSTVVCSDHQVAYLLPNLAILFWENRNKRKKRGQYQQAQRAVSRAKQAISFPGDLSWLINRHCCKQWDHYIGYEVA
jgi:hypothetical protein